jgi:SAM-dependent methyltransferase
MNSISSPLRLARSVGGTVFGEDAKGYEAGRIGYPAELYDAIRARRGSAVGPTLEIGPGTGLATRDILTRLSPARLVAVEADPALARHLETSIGDPRVTVTQGDFLTAPIDPGFALACSAASFHWLEPVGAFARLREVLIPGGTLALWWNTYRVSGIGDPFADAVTPLLADIELPPSEGAEQHYSLDVDHHRDAIGGAGFVEFEPHLFRRERVLRTAEVRTLFASYSYVRALATPRRDALLAAIAAIADRDFGGNVPNVVLSALYLATSPGA